MPKCTECGISAKYRKNIYAHMRRVHNIKPDVTGKLLCPLDCCNDTFHHYKVLREHIQKVHNISLEMEQHQFLSFDEFKIWKKDYEMSTGSCFRQRKAEQTLGKKSIRRSVLLCHGSGFFKSRSKGLRNHRDDWRTTATCPAMLEVSRPIAEDGVVTVIVRKTHLGHNVKKRPSEKKDCISQVCVILPAAGHGERMQVGEPKQFMLLQQRPVILHTVEAFLKMTFVDRVVVVAASDAVTRMVNILTLTTDSSKLVVVEGAETRHASIKAGLFAIEPHPEIVVIHDAVRPFVSEEIVAQVVSEARSNGAAGFVCPLVSTVVSRDGNGLLEESLDRSRYWASETPQAFQYSSISKAYAMCTEEDLLHGTECLQLVHKYAGIKAKLIQAPQHLWKITHAKDIFAAEGVLKASQTVCIVPKISVPKQLHMVLKKTFREVLVRSDLKEPWTTADNWVVMNESEDLQPPTDRLTHPVALVYILRDGMLPFDARPWRHLNILVYFVKCSPDDSDKICEWSDLVTSLLKDSNPYICGTVFNHQ